MIRVAFPPIGGQNWLGGYNYVLNLVQALARHAPDAVRPVMFFPADADAAATGPFEAIGGVEVIRTPVFAVARRGCRLARALATGVDAEALGVFRAARIDVVFEAAQFFGWRLPLPAIAWFSDFQHRHMRHLFGARAYWKREIGFQAQLRSRRQVMVSSAAAAADCACFYPPAQGRIAVVRFAVPQQPVEPAAARKVADGYGLPARFLFLPNQFWVHKNHAVVVEALALLGAGGHDVVVAATGREHDPRDPSHVDRLRARIAGAGLDNNFRRLGLVPAGHLPALMAACSAMLNPSTFEGWSTTVEEAKAMGTPMLLSRIAVHREQAGDTATLFDPRDADALAAATLDALGRPPVGAAERQAAAIAAEARVAAFAADFVDLVSAAAG